MLVRIHSLSIVIFLLVLESFVMASPALAQQRPNILWLVADDLSPELGCYGYKGVHTPNIDRLAREGERFTRAFSTAPVCSSSRSAFITGVYQTSTGTHQHRTETKKPLPESVVPITQLLQQAGYFVGNSNSTMKRPGKEDYNFAHAEKLFDGVDWTNRAEGQPFFAQIQIHEPHRDFIKAKDIHRAEDVKIPSYYPEHPVIRADWAHYLASIERLDDHVGKVMKRLEDEGLLDNTVVFFFGDHGRPHYRDKQWLYNGGIGVPLIVRWPPHVTAGKVRSEQVSLIDVSAATVAAAGLEVPTWMDGRNLLANDFTGREYIYAARDRCGNTVDRIRSVQTTDFKYIRNFYPKQPYTQHSGYKELQYPGMTVARVMKLRGELTGPPALFWADSRPAEELYDLKADPEEINNLANDPALQEKLKEFRDQLNQWIEETDDQGRFPEPGVEKVIEASNQWYRNAMKRRSLTLNMKPEQYLNWWESMLGVQ